MLKSFGCNLPCRDIVGIGLNELSIRAFTSRKSAFHAENLQKQHSNRKEGIGRAAELARLPIDTPDDRIWPIAACHDRPRPLVSSVILVSSPVLHLFFNEVIHQVAVHFLDCIRIQALRLCPLSSS